MSYRLLRSLTHTLFWGFNTENIPCILLILFQNADCISSCSRMPIAFHLVPECPLHFILFQNVQCIIHCILFCSQIPMQMQLYVIIISFPNKTERGPERPCRITTQGSSLALEKSHTNTITKTRVAYGNSPGIRINTRYMMYLWWSLYTLC